MEQGKNYDSNPFRADLPIGIGRLSPELYDFLRELIEKLRQFNTDSLSGALRLSQYHLVTRHGGADYPIGSKGVFQLEGGETLFARFVHFHDDVESANVGRFVFESLFDNVTDTGSSQQFVGVDFTCNGAGRYGWVATGGVIPAGAYWHGGPHQLLGLASTPVSFQVGEDYIVAVSLPDDRVRLVPLFHYSTPGNVVDLGPVIARLVALESRCAELEAGQAELEASIKGFNDSVNLGLSRLEARQNNVEFKQVYQKMITMAAGVAELSESLKLTAEKVDAQTGLVIARAQTSYDNSISSQVFSTDSAWWATISSDWSIQASAASDTSQGYATVAQTAAASASSDAAAASSSAHLAASVVPSTFNKDPFFTTTYPGDWTYWSGPAGGFTVVPGIVAANAIEITNLGVATAVGLNQFPPLQPGWFVLDVTIRLNGGSLNSAGVYMANYNGSSFVGGEVRLDFRVDPDINGDVLGAGVVGTLYRFSKLVKVTPGSPMTTVAMYVMTSWSGFTSAVDSIADITWYFCGLRAASSAEIAAGTPFDPSALQAQIDTLNTVQASQAGDITILNNDVANLFANDVTITGNISALASTVTSLSTTVSGHTATLTTYGTSINGLQAQYGVTINLDGTIGGFALLGGGGTIAFIIKGADFFIKTASGAVNLIAVTGDRVSLGVDLYLGSNRIISDNGTVMKVTGTGFGTSNQFVEWFGPSMNPNTCTEGAAIYYLKVNGDAYFGGALNAGVIKNAAQTTSTTPLPSISLGTIGSNGNPRNVTLSYTYSRSQDGGTGNPNNDSGSCSVDVAIKKSGVTLATQTFTGSWSRSSYAGPSDPAHFDQTVGGSLSFTDSSGGTSVEYSAVVTARSDGPGLVANIMSDSIIQILGIIEIEN